MSSYEEKARPGLQPACHARKGVWVLGSVFIEIKTVLWLSLQIKGKLEV